MNIEQLYKDLSYNKLSNLAMGSDGTGVVLDAHKPKIILAADEALLRLHTKFVLKEKDLLIEMVDHITNYHLSAKFAESSFGSTTQPYLYIKDLMAETFQDDVVRILSVQTEFGCTLPLNDEGQELSLFTPQGNVLQVPRPEEGRVLVVLYQARHPKLQLDDENQEIELPDCLHEAMRSYIAYLVYSGMNTQESTMKSQEHLAMYNSLCQEAIEQDLVSTSLSVTSNRFNKRGWI